MKKLMVLMLSLLLCACSTSENKEKETPKEDPKNENTTVSFVGVGDNLIHEMIYKQADAAAGEMNDGKYDFTEMYTHVKKDIQKADLAYIDQESIVGGDALGISGYPTFNTPADIAKNVADTGFDIVNTANNHCLDKYQEGIDYSHEIWAKQKGIITAGTYTSQKDRDTIRTIKRKGITFSFLAYTYGTNGIEPPNPYSVAYFDEDRIREDVKKAKQLLKEAGVSDLKLTLICSESVTRLNAATIIQSMLSDVGIDVEIQSYESGTVLNMIDAGETELFIMGFGAVGFPEPDNNIYGPFHSKQIPTNNMGFYKDPKLDEMLDEQRFMTDGPEREKLIKDIQKYLRENLPVIPLANTKQVIGIRSNIKNFVPTQASSHFVDKVDIE